MSLSIGSLFSGIGGLDLGAEWAGLGHIAYQVEIAPFARCVLQKNAGERFPIFEDITQCRGFIARLGNTHARPHVLPPVHIIIGGFPCQGISQAGKRAGFEDPRSFLWNEMRRVIAEQLPAGVLIENVVELVRSGLDKRVVSDLEALGYSVDAPAVLSSEDLGAPQRRLRVFIVAVRPELATFYPDDFVPYVESHLHIHRWPVLRDQDPQTTELPRTLPKATRYPGSFKRERLHAIGNAVMPAMGCVAAKQLIARLCGAKRLRVAPPIPKHKPLGTLWPTPVTTDAKGSRRATSRRAGFAGTGNDGVTLTDAVWRASSADWGRPLNPDWVETLMGLPVGWTMP